MVKFLFFSIFHLLSSITLTIYYFISKLAFSTISSSFIIASFLRLIFFSLILSAFIIPAVSFSILILLAAKLISFFLVIFSFFIIIISFIFSIASLESLPVVWPFIILKIFIFFLNLNHQHLNPLLMQFNYQFFSIILK